MPDQNKLQKLKDVGYQIRATCKSCKFFQKGTISNNAWGVCSKHQYTHLKHSAHERSCSITIDGWCPQFELEPDYSNSLGAHKQFMEENHGG